MNKNELVEKAINWFQNIVEKTKHLTSGNVAHKAVSIRGTAIRAAEYLEKYKNVEDLTLTKYILLPFPESQMVMEHERFHECLFIQDIEGHDEVGSSAYMCPEDLYYTIIQNKEED